MLPMASFPFRDLAFTVAWIGNATGAIAPLLDALLGKTQCGWRDSNSQGKATRPSNVRVYQFRHIRVALSL